MVYHGSIVTCDEKGSVFSYLVSLGGKIVFLGQELTKEYENLPVTELEERSLLPAFGDSHIHFSSYALFAGTLDVRTAHSNIEMIDMISAYAFPNKVKQVIGFGSSAHSVDEKTLIQKSELDRACPGKPVMIVKYDGHASTINTCLIEKLPEKIKQLRGFHADTGIMKQEAFFAVTDFVTAKVSLFALLRFMLEGVDRLADRGIGMMHTVESVGFALDMDVDLVRFFARGLQNAFQTRLFFQTMDIRKVQKRKLPRIGGCFKTALDGCFGTVDAAMLEAYLPNTEDTATDNRGILYYDDAAVIDFVTRANRAGLQVEMHAIGDAAFEQAVKAIEAALMDFPRENHRHTIIHVCLPTKEGLEMIARLGIGVAAQPAFLDWPLEPLSYLEEIMGDRAYQISPLRTMLDMGIHVSGGSDAPCTLPDPIEGIYAACNHYVPEQSVTIPEALRMFTYETARMSFDEKERGSLEVGKVADFAILNRDPLSMKKEDLRSLAVEKLILSGRNYKKGQTLGNLAKRAIFKK